MGLGVVEAALPARLGARVQKSVGSLRSAALRAGESPAEQQREATGEAHPEPDAPGGRGPEHQRSLGCGLSPDRQVHLQLNNTLLDATAADRAQPLQHLDALRIVGEHDRPKTPDPLLLSAFG